MDHVEGGAEAHDHVGDRVVVLEHREAPESLLFLNFFILKSEKLIISMILSLSKPLKIGIFSKS